MLKVSVIGYRKVLGTSITIPIEMLNAADLINRIEGGKQERLALQLVSMDGGNIQLNAGTGTGVKAEPCRYRRYRHGDIAGLVGQSAGRCQAVPGSE